MSTYSEKIADFAVNLRFESIPTEVITKAKLHLLDSIGVGLASRSQPFVQSIVNALKGLSSKKESSIIGDEELISREYAACVNGALIHGLDFDDTHIPSIIHASSCIVPTVLACGEAKRVTGKKALEALVLGYEVIARVGMATNNRFHEKGAFHATSLCGTFAVSLAVGKIEGETPQQLVNGLGISGSQAAGIQQFLIDGTWVKRLHPGWAAHSGIIASLLASQGFTGPSEVFEGSLGFFSAYLGLDNCKVDALTEGLGEVWETLRIQIKPYPCCLFNHSFIDCALKLKEEQDIQWQDIREIQCIIRPREALIICEPIQKKKRVTTSYGARFSLPYVIAVALVEGKVELEHFSERFINDERVIATAGKVACVKDKRLSQETEHFPGDLRIVMKNGKKYRYSERFERGSQENPILEDEIEKKFRTNLTEAGINDRERIDDVLDAIYHFERVTNLREFTAFLRELVYSE